MILQRVMWLPYIMWVYRVALAAPGLAVQDGKSMTVVPSKSLTMSSCMLVPAFLRAYDYQQCMLRVPFGRLGVMDGHD